MKSLLQKYNLILIFALLALLSGCEAQYDNGHEDEREPEVLNSLSFNLTRGLPMGSLTDPNASTDEWFFDWHIVVVDNKGKIEVVIHRSGLMVKDDKHFLTLAYGIENIG